MSRGLPVAQEVAVESAPLFLMVGAITGCSFKEAAMYVRSLAARYVTCADQGYFHVVKDGERFLFEIQEGGCGRSILPNALDELERTNEIVISLANNKFVAIQTDADQLYSLIGTEDETNSSTGNYIEYADLIGKQRLRRLIKNKAQLTHFSLGLSAVSVSMLALTLLLTVFGKSYLQDKFIMSKYRQHQIEMHQESNNPLLALIKAKANAEKEGRTIGKLSLKEGEWSWELQ